MTVCIGTCLTFSLPGTAPSLLTMTLSYNILFATLHDLIEKESFTAGCLWHTLNVLMQTYWQTRKLAVVYLRHQLTVKKLAYIICNVPRG